MLRHIFFCISIKIPTNTPLFHGNLNGREAQKVYKYHTKALTKVKTLVLQHFFLLFLRKVKNIFFLTSALNNKYFVIVHSTSFTFQIPIYRKYDQSLCMGRKILDFIKENNVEFIKSHENWYIWKVCCKLIWEDLCREKSESSMFCLSDTEASVFTFHQSVFTEGLWTLD